MSFPPWLGHKILPRGAPQLHSLAIQCDHILPYFINYLAMEPLFLSMSHCPSYHEGPHSHRLSAYRGKHLLDLPYAVKGMDCSFSGILASIDLLAASLKPPNPPRLD